MPPLSDRGTARKSRPLLAVEKCKRQLDVRARAAPAPNWSPRSEYAEQQAKIIRNLRGDGENRPSARRTAGVRASLAVDSRERPASGSGYRAGAAKEAAKSKSQQRGGGRVAQRQIRIGWLAAGAAVAAADRGGSFGGAAIIQITMNIKMVKSSTATMTLGNAAAAAAGDRFGGGIQGRERPGEIAARVRAETPVLDWVAVVCSK